MEIVLSVQSVKYPLTGIGRYTYELARHIPNVRDVSSLRLFTGDRFVDCLPEAGSLSSDDATSTGMTSPRQAAKRFLARSRLLVDVYRFLRARTERSPFKPGDGQVYHGTNFYVPEFPGASVVTIHDLSVFTMPNFHPRERVTYLSREVEASLRRVDQVVADSDYTRDEIVAYFGLPADRVSVAKLASGEEFRPRAEAEVASVLAQYGLTYGAYTFYAGTIEPRKNLEHLIEAYSRLSPAIRQSRPLVLAGYKGWNNARIMQAIERGRREGWVKHLGYLPNSHLPMILSGAALFAFPSRYEGFGLPVLEAMASGIPVVTSPVSSLPEVGGEAVLYAEPDDIEQLTQACETALFQTEWRRKAVQAGIERAATFTWDRCAEQTAEAYRLALARTRR